MPKLIYPDLPIIVEKQNIIEALQKNSIIIVAGETGSGKTTQLPKICLEAGYGVKGMIAHTQPRRIAAKSVALRIAQELESELGTYVGYQIRFTNKASATTNIKIMTDGILLSQTQFNRNLSQYDCIIIDEAHERSLNIDFLLGYLKQLVISRPELRVIITSATIDEKKFSDFFNNAPLISVAGRSYPIDVVYEKSHDSEEDRDNTLPIIRAVKMAYQEGPGDILIFQSGEKEIRECCEVLAKTKLPNTQIFPLFARQSVKDQQQIFKQSNARKIIVATNVAETSLTVPGIRYVIDTGLVRLSRYNYRSKVQRLPIEPASQASCDQRKGRCGRVGPGICYRLYTMEDYLSRPLFTQPEIQRTNLAAVILKMLSLNLNKIEQFPFIDPPDFRFIKDGFGLLERLNAVEQGKITTLGRILAKIPIEPKLGRMIIAGNEYGVLNEILIIVSALSIVDPRERPREAQEKAEMAHAPFTHPQSDFLSFLNLWRFIFEKRQYLSNTQFRHLCHENFLSYLRVCEWFDIHTQLKQLAQELGFKFNQLESEDNLIHKAILTGILDGVGLKEENKEYLGARGIKFIIHPGSGIYKKPPQWLMSYEIVHTTKMYARVNAAIDPKMIEEVAIPLLKRQYSEPHFEKRSGHIAAFERVSLFGLPVVVQRKINYEKINSSHAREIFILEGLVLRNAQIDLPFYHKNNETLESLEKLSDRIRKDTYFIDENFLMQFYNEKIPADVYSVITLKKWLKDKNDNFLVFTFEDASALPDIEDIQTQYPPQVTLLGEALNLEYKFDPDASDDGVTLLVPLSKLLELKEKNISGIIPGLEEKKVKAKNKQAPFLQLHYKIIDKKGEVLAKGNELQTIFEELKEQHFQDIHGKHPLEREGITQWDFMNLPESVDVKKGALHFTYYPALVDNIEAVSIALFDIPLKAKLHHRYGVARLAMMTLKDPIRQFKKSLSPSDKKLLVAFGDNTIDTIPLAAAIALWGDDADCIRTQVAFENSISEKRKYFPTHLNRLSNVILSTLKLRMSVLQNLHTYQNGNDPDRKAIAQDIEQQLAQLFEENFIIHVPITWLMRYPVYLEAISLRLEKIASQPQKDKPLMREITLIKMQYNKKLQEYDNQLIDPFSSLSLFKWRIEELRVSLFAQSLKTIEPVSTKRLLKLLDNLST